MSANLLKTGLTVEIKISSQVKNANADIKTFSLQKRMCQYKDENIVTGTLFDTYSQDNCLYDCAIKHISLNFSCIPWDIPFHFVEGKTQLCPGNHAKLFKERLNSFNTSKCDCLPSCSSIVYESQVK